MDRNESDASLSSVYTLTTPKKRKKSTMKKLTNTDRVKDNAWIYFTELKKNSGQRRPIIRPTSVGLM